MKSNVFTKEILVPASAIDELRHVNNLIYMNWCLEAAESHWLSATNEDIRNEYVWVVLEHSISYKNPSFEGEHLVIETWIDSFKGVRSERKYRIIRPSDQKTIIEAKSLWCLLNAKTHRPTIITEDLASLF